MKIIVLFIASFLFTTNVNALFCDTSEFAKQKTIASHVRYTEGYDFSEEGDLEAYIELYNFQDNFDLFLKGERINLNTYEKNGYGAYIIPVSSGATTSFGIYLSDDINCWGNKLRDLNVNFPKYNEFYSHEVCANNGNLRQCELWFQHTMDEDTFVNLIESLTREESLEEEDKEPYGETRFDVIISFLIKYYYVFIIALVIGLFGYKKYISRKDFDLKA